MGKRLGLTATEVATVRAYQKGKCAICRRKPRLVRDLSLDHDHRTGLIRGLLCDRCNYQLLPLVNERRWLLESAAEYLWNPPAVRALNGARFAPDSPGAHGILDTENDT